VPAPDVVVVVEIVRLELRRRARRHLGARQIAQDQIEQRTQVFARALELELGDPGPCVGVDDGELELLVGGVEVDEQPVDLVQHLADTRVVAIDLVDADERREPRLERLPQHEARLRQRPFGRVDQQQHAVDHRQRALDLTAEVGMPGRVDDVDLDVVVADRGVLREDREAPLTLDRVRVHHPIGDLLVLAKDAALAEQRIDECGLAVVDVRDDGDVADVGAPLGIGVHPVGR
jgi:hypothetical protein